MKSFLSKGEKLKKMLCKSQIIEMNKRAANTYRRSYFNKVADLGPEKCIASTMDEVREHLKVAANCLA